jgi:hypothetical protein
MSSPSSLRLPRIDGATALPHDRTGGSGDFPSRGVHDRPRAALRPKKRGPFHWVPVMARATDESDLYRRPFVLEAVRDDGDDVLDVLPLADQLGAGDRPVVASRTLAALRLPSVKLLGQRCKPGPGLWLQPAIGEFLDAVGEPGLEEGAIVGRRLRLEEVAPLLLQVRHRRGLQRREAGKHGIGHQPFSVSELA